MSEDNDEERRITYDCSNCGHHGESKVPETMVAWILVCEKCGQMV